MAITTSDLNNSKSPPNSYRDSKGVIKLLSDNPVKDDDSRKMTKVKKKKISPYLKGEKFQLLSRITEKRLLHKKNEIFSSFPLATNIYRASSDEFKELKKSRQKPRKSVHTIPNILTILPQTHTVSDMNDSDYFNLNTGQKPLIIKKREVMRNRKPRVRTKDNDYCDQYSPYQYLSSAETLNKNNSKGDSKKVATTKKSLRKDDFPADVWEVLRNMHRVPLRPKRNDDEDSLISPKVKQTYTKKCRNVKKGRRLIETYRTQEIAYVANFELESKTSDSRSSSFDRVTVINKNELQQDAEFGKANARNMNTQKITGRQKKCFTNTNERSTHIREIRVGQAGKNRSDDNKLNPQTTYSFGTLSTNNSSCAQSCNKKTILHPNDIKNYVNNTSCVSKSCDSCNDFENREKVMRIHVNNEKTTRVMTQMINNTNHNLGDQDQLLKPKPRLVTTMPSGTTMPYPTVADLKKKIAQIRFPLVILGREQVSSGIEVIDYDHLQFNGLDEHIWPFMVEWKKKNVCSKKYPTRRNGNIPSDVHKVKNEISLINRTKIAGDTLHGKQDVMQQEVPVLKIQRKGKLFHHSKDKTLTILYKNTPEDAVISSTSHNKCTFKENTQKVDAATEVTMSEDKLKNIHLEKLHNLNPKKNQSTKAVMFDEHNSPIPKKPEEIIAGMDKPSDAIRAFKAWQPNAKYPWGRVKWVSDFIDTVMKKIKNGSYYGFETDSNLATNRNTVKSNDVSLCIQSSSCTDQKEVSSLTFANTNCTNKVDTVFEDEIYDPTIQIPGFDDAVPSLEIKKLTASQIEVKNHMRNVVLKFDVTVPVPGKQSDTFLRAKGSSSTSICIPLSVTESCATVYKCSTTILNAVLPEELCTVLPKLMENILSSSTSGATSKGMAIGELSDSDSQMTMTFGCTDHGAYTPSANCPWMAHYGTYNQWNPLQNSQMTASQQNQWVALQNNPLLPFYNPLLPFSNNPLLSSSHNAIAPSTNNPLPPSSNNLQSQNYPLMPSSNIPHLAAPNNLLQPPPCTPLLPSLPNNPLFTPLNYQRMAQQNAQLMSAQRAWNNGWVHGWPMYQAQFMSPVLKEILSGKFGAKHHKRSVNHKLKQKINLRQFENTILPLPSIKAIMKIMVDVPKFEYCDKYDEKKINQEIYSNSSIDVIPHETQMVDCKLLTLYEGPKRTPTFENFAGLLQKLWRDFNSKVNVFKYISSHSIAAMINNNNDITVYVGDSQGNESTMLVTVTKLHISSLFDRDGSTETASLCMPEVSLVNSIENSQELLVTKNSKDLQVANIKKTREMGKKVLVKRKSYVKLYKKCKSSSNIGGERLKSTPLDKIFKIEDLLEVLGPCKDLCSVFDGTLSQKVLSSVGEMKSWIKDITPRQALLVILLANKKDTQNLIRFRPVILQGIAMNRITRSLELDMEIEVIEKENVIITQCDRIPYAQTTVINQKTLFEELCWIAKTTASDYQRPFDENSEKLLRSLIEKRKSLNPSYLRVMARYVGLGLLKKPSKM